MHIRGFGGIARRTAAIRRKHRAAKGFTLMEVIVAATLLLVALAGIVPFFVTGLSQASTVRYKSIATNVARECVEKIRQLDYREISDGDEEDGGIQTLQDRFGTSVAERGITFTISYNVDREGYGSGSLKKVTVDVTWADESVSAAGASITTLIHQQYLGPRISALTVEPATADPLHTPFRMLNEATRTTVKIHIAEADWGLVYDNLGEATMAPREGVYARLVLFDSSGQPFLLGDPASDHMITGLAYTTNFEGAISDVYFYYEFQSETVPDGYWEMRGTVYNKYDEPGNVWRLEVRAENGPPGQPDLTVTATDDETVEVTWYGAPERDRAYYVLERRWLGSPTWSTLASDLDPDATSYPDHGSVVGHVDPWGDDTTTNEYEYRLWAVDIANKSGEVNADTAGCTIPTTTTTNPSSTTTSSTTTSTTSTSTTSTTVFTTGGGTVVNHINKTYSVVVRGPGGPYYYSVDGLATITISGLPAGSYSITAAHGSTVVTSSFTLPDRDGTVLLEILR